MNQKTFEKFLARDGGCVHCGVVEEAVNHHRANRGYGGSKLLDKPSNILVMCSELNGLMESDAGWAERARQYGWKISKYAIPELEAVYYPLEDSWYYLDDLLNKTHI